MHPQEVDDLPFGNVKTVADGIVELHGGAMEWSLAAV
jgi:hypothetical protein